jgi:hypothetical protein
MNGMKIDAGWLMNLHTFSNLQLLLAMLTVASKFTDWRYVTMWNQTWITQAERKTLTSLSGTWCFYYLLATLVSLAVL